MFSYRKTSILLNSAFLNAGAFILKNMFGGWGHRKGGYWHFYNVIAIKCFEFFRTFKKKNLPYQLLMIRYLTSVVHATTKNVVT